MLKDITGHSFCNWARTLKFQPDHFYKPDFKMDVSEIVRTLAKGKVVRTQGAGHSWSQLVSTHDTLVSLDCMKGLDDPKTPIRLGKTADGPTATVPAGIRLKDLTNLLGHGKFS